MSAQDNWRWCRNCQGLWWEGDPAKACCPAGTSPIGIIPHVADGSADYALAVDDTSAPGQQNWRWCERCDGLWFAGNNSAGFCPRDRVDESGNASGHVSSGRGDYVLPLGNQGACKGQGDWRWCRKCQGLWFAGNLHADGSPNLGVCPIDSGGHTSEKSGDYHIPIWG